MTVEIAEPWRPGLNAIRTLGVPAWTPCLTREQDDAGRPGAREHAWFLDLPGTLYCWECRRGRPRVVYGPADRIGAIRTAIEDGDHAYVAELVRRLADPAAPSVPAMSPRPQPVDGPVEDIPAIQRPGAAFTAEITIVCESVRPGCEYRALFFDRATAQFYGGSGASALEALAWCMDEYIARVAHGMPVSPARKSTDTPGSRFAATEPVRKAA